MEKRVSYIRICLLFLLIAIHVNVVSGYADEEACETWVQDRISEMSMEEKVAQLFVITPEALTGVGQVTMAGETTRERLAEYPVGGLIYFSDNILSEEQITEMLSNSQRYSYELLQIPLLTCIDEEGGSVSRISGRGIIDVSYIDSMKNVGSGTESDAYDTGREIGDYLDRLGFNVDFAPVSDVVTNYENTVIGDRAFGNDAQKVALMVKAFVDGMHEYSVATTLKHFPGHGNTKEDSHYSGAFSDKTIEELRDCEFLPFQEGIKAGTDLIMAGHISLPNVTGDDIPATLSHMLITDILREEMGYSGVVITDAMNMAAIADSYTSAEAAVKAIQAGIDMILMPYDFDSAYQGILNAVNQNEIEEIQIDEALKRILRLKWKMFSCS